MTWLLGQLSKYGREKGTVGSLGANKSGSFLTRKGLSCFCLHSTYWLLAGEKRWMWLEYEAELLAAHLTFFCPSNGGLLPARISIICKIAWDH